MVVAGMSDKKLLSNTCDANSGKKGKKMDAAAMLNMLPKLALMVARMYFKVLANVDRPSSMP